MKFPDYLSVPIYRMEKHYTLKLLTPGARRKAKQVIDICKNEEFDLIFFSSLRHLDEQAIFYRQSRSWEEIKLKIKELRNTGFDFLADAIEKVGYRKGLHVTDAAPGESWHNYGEAWDAAPMINNGICFTYSDGKKYWNKYGKAIRKVGMYWGGNWHKPKDYPHAQLREYSNPLKVLTPDQVYDKLKRLELLK